MAETYIITEDGKTITTEDGKILVTEGEIIVASQTAIMAAIKVRMPTDVPEINQTSIVPDPDFLPAASIYPQIGLKDGGVIRTEDYDKYIRETVTIMVYAYVQILRDEASIMGHLSELGVLDILSRYHSRFDHNNLSLNKLTHAWCEEEYASEMMVGENVFIQRKGCRYVYKLRYRR